MGRFILKNNLYLLTVLAAAVGIFTAVQWAAMPVMQRVIGLFFVAIVLHLWEEGRFPGGFTEMIASKLDFLPNDVHFGEIITACLVLTVGLVPFLFPTVAVLTVAPMLLGVLEAVAHVAAIRMFGLPRFYSPGMTTALLLLLPLSLVGIWYLIESGQTRPVDWLFAALFLVASLMLAQSIVVRASGMPYAEFLRKVRATLLQRRG